MSLKLAVSYFVIASVLLTAAPVAFGQGKSTTNMAKSSKPKTSQWPTAVRYSVLSDYANNRSPRAYTHNLSGNVSYNINSKWSVGTDLGLSAETIKGQIEKGPEQSHSETLNPSVTFETAFSDSFSQRHKYGVAGHVEPLFDKPSRLEGYKAIVGLGGTVVFSFFGKAYSMGHSFDVSEVINTFEFDAEGNPNPDYFYTYKFVNSLRFLGNNKFSVVFGVKATRYLDGFLGYNYQNSFSLSHSWQNLTLAGSYDNGGFTDDGRVRLWYIDEYRRVATLMVSYSF